MDFDRNAVFPQQPQEPGTGPQADPGYPQAQVVGYPAAPPPGAGYPVAQAPVPGYPVGQAPVPGYPAAYPPPPAPEGTSVLRALQASLVWAGVAVVLVFTVGDVTLSGYGLGLALGRLLPISLVSGLLVRLFVKRKRLAFGWLVLASLPTFVISFVVIGAILFAGQQR
ncbi:MULTISPECIES: hypothetical protein [Saccharothrix]|uniref:hypothetical protein n=1 Tax=Saccharothrix TaxID=2071 RepID=UPI00093F0C33|nr:hypothetical protein [Saccharothrix sp. CB00851]OKI25004.1 hypothetical protein A6A25_34020 [Saccharothrix sp. CB00851]